MKKIMKWIGGAILLGVLAYFSWSFSQSVLLYMSPSERLLSETGYRDVEVPVSPRFPFWSDGAIKNRFIYLPPEAKIDNTNSDRWNFPVGTRIWKDFKRDGVLVETRMLYKHGEAPWDWDMAAYVWRDDLSDADKLLFGESNARATQHDIPSPKECSSCHGEGNNRRPLGVTALQLPWQHQSDLSLSKLSESNLLAQPISEPYVIPGDAITRNVLGYLDTNCGTCHHEGSTYVDKEVPLRLNLTTDTIASVVETNVYRTTINKAPLIEGLDTVVYIKPGSATESFVFRRMSLRDRGLWQMPPIASEEVDEHGIEIIHAWINSLSRNPKSAEPAIG